MKTETRLKQKKRAGERIKIRRKRNIDKGRKEGKLNQYKKRIEQKGKKLLKTSVDVQSCEVGEVVGGKLSTFTQLLASLRSQTLKSGGNFFLTQENKKRRRTEGHERRSWSEVAVYKLVETSL